MRLSPEKKIANERLKKSESGPFPVRMEVIKRVKDLLGKEVYERFSRKRPGGRP
jgi:hypothetical protein